MEKEKIYDTQIAPLLLQACKICQDNGLPFIAVVEYTEGEHGRTEYLGKAPGIGMLMLSWAAHARDNIDRLIQSAVNHAKIHGHGSIFLTMLKVPTKYNEAKHG